ncbi:hypothetical protein K2Z83_17380 [Oscillochloris sp. ZM17-4]|uniref:hypothetical protein n=1 Tax=Oscillochloris sp. ZM17-4 TaxID=2866714 RepID=UPI001C73B624|nr:hypothetical protein [Oscillochloris sp. ZM17-4]MBX0329446.1 hypothetical protein [Oscillochloris sp. ZM17-4]
MSDSDNLTPRQLRAAERFQEDEGLAGSLTDEPASQLVRWACEAAVRAAAPQYSDEQADAMLAAIRQATRQAARQAAAGGQDVIAVAQAALAMIAPERTEVSVAEVAEPQPPTPNPQPPTPNPQPPTTLRRRIESLRVRLISLIGHRPS